MLTCLWHWTICSINNQDGSIHLSCPSNHVLHIVSMARTVYVRIVTVASFIFYVSSRDCYPTRFFFRRTINLVICLKITKVFCNRSCQSRLTMVHVTNRSNVAVRFTTIKLFLCHRGLLLVFFKAGITPLAFKLREFRLNFVRYILRHWIIMIKLH